MGGFYGILLIVALVAVSGLIAYIGDILGRRMGRKRLSLFGLRPRHTAIVISVVAGMLITLFTLFMAMLVNQNVKDGFLKVDQMRRAQKELSHEVDALNQRIAALGESRRGLENQVKRSEAELASGRRELAAGRARLAETNKQLEQTNRQLESTAKELSRKQQELGKTKADLAEFAQLLKNADQAFRRTSLAKSRLQDQIDALRGEASRAGREYAIERSVPILFGAGQPLDAELISGGQAVASARAQLDAFVARLNGKVTAAGARPLASGGDAVIIQRPVRDPRTSQIAVASPHQVLDAIANRVRESQGDVIVRAFSVFNTHAGEPVYLDFELFRNILVFRRGEALAETVIDGQLSEPALMGSLVHLLREEVGAKAREKNVMPRFSPGTVNMFGSAGEKVGEMTYDDLFRVIEKLRRVGGPARVTAVAAEDTWTVGPLKVEIRVAPVTVAVAH